MFDPQTDVPPTHGPMSHPLDSRCELAAVIARQAATVDRTIGELLAARQRLVESRTTVEAVTSKAEELRTAGSETELPPSVSALETVRREMSRMDLTVDTGLTALIQELSRASVALRCIMGRIVAEPRASGRAA